MYSWWFFKIKHEKWASSRGKDCKDTPPLVFQVIVTCLCSAKKKKNQTHQLYVSQYPRQLVVACFPSLREVCPPNCLEGSVASWEAVNPILKATGCHLTSAITRFNHKLLSHLKNIRIIIFSLLEKQTNPVNTLICCWMGNRFYCFFLFEYLFFWVEQLHFSPKPMSGENSNVKLYAYLHTYKLAFIVAEYNFKWCFAFKLLGGWILWESVGVGSKTSKSILPAFSDFIQWVERLSDRFWLIPPLCFVFLWISCMSNRCHPFCMWGDKSVLASQRNSFALSVTVFKLQTSATITMLPIAQVSYSMTSSIPLSCYH